MMAYYNKRTTGDPLLLPHLLNERVYSPFPLFLWEQPKPGLTFHDPVFARFYQATKEEYGYEANKTFAGIVAAETARFATDWFFYCGVALSFPMLVDILSIWRQPSRRIVIFVALSTAVAVALCTYTMFHYAAPATIAIYIFAIEGLRYLWEQRSTLEQAFVIAVCATVFVSSLARQTGSAAVNAKFAFPDNREHILEQLRDKPGKQLVLVSYDLDNHYPGEELVHNWAELDAQKVLWARSKGSGNDADLCRIYPDRQFWWAVASNAGYSLAPYDLCKAAK